MEQKNQPSIDENMLNELSINGANIFMTAFYLDMQDKDNKTFEGKKLGDISLHIELNTDESEADHIEKHIPEKLVIRMISLHEINDELRQKFGEDIYNSIAAEALFYSDIRLCDEFDIDKNRIWHRALRSKYIRRLSSTSPAMAIDTVSGLYRPEMAEAALSFQERAEEYVRSTDFYTPYGLRKIIAERNYFTADPISHFWGIPFKPGLIFNGHENIDYLRQFLNYANKELYEKENDLRHLSSSNQKDAETLKTIDLLACEIAELKTSIASAADAFENNKNTK